MNENQNIDSLQSFSLSTERIIVTGAAGFIGSCMLQYLNEQGYENLVLVDDFGVEEKRQNWEVKKFETIVERYNLFDWLEQHNPEINFVIHLGARTDTTEFDYAIHQELNVDYSQNIWNYCTTKRVPLIYASSAATYGGGETGYDDNQQPEKLHPLNPYGVSKNEFDKWALQQQTCPPFWAGLKFFNVYGPNEYHKARMASVIFHSFNQIKKEGVVKLFKSHKEGFEDGKQLRDFVYVKDVVKVVGWMMREYKLTENKLTENKLTAKDNNQSSVISHQSSNADKTKLTDDSGQWTELTAKDNNQSLAISHLSSNDPSSIIRHLSSGIYNLGTGKARTFEDLVKATFAGLDIKENIKYIDMPEDIRDKYQYFTEANMNKLKEAGYSNEFYSLEEGVDDYVRNYLSKNKMY